VVYCSNLYGVGKYCDVGSLHFHLVMSGVRLAIVVQRDASHHIVVCHCILNGEGFVWPSWLNDGDLEAGHGVGDLMRNGWVCLPGVGPRE
jgi:hypothetical protein